MRMRWWIVVCVSSIFALSGNAAHAQDHEHGHGHDKEHHDDDRGWYNQHDRDNMRHWYREHDERRDLPPGLAKRDQLPPGLERQLIVRGTLPPGLRRRIQPCPPELVRELPPPPPECEHVIIGGHIVLLNRRTNVVVDIVHFERD